MTLFTSSYVILVNEQVIDKIEILDSEKCKDESGVGKS